MVEYLLLLFLEEEGEIEGEKEVASLYCIPGSDQDVDPKKKLVRLKLRTFQKLESNPPELCLSIKLDT